LIFRLFPNNQYVMSDLAVLVRVGSDTERGLDKWASACSGCRYQVPGNNSEFVVAPFGLFHSVLKDIESSHDGPYGELAGMLKQSWRIECCFSRTGPWHRAAMVAVLPLWQECPEFVALISSASSPAPLSIQPFGKGHSAMELGSTFVLLEIMPSDDVVIPMALTGNKIAAVGDLVHIFGCPFASHLGRKFMNSRYSSHVAQMGGFPGGMILLDTSSLPPGMEGAPIVYESALQGFVGYPITCQSEGAVFHIGWSLLSIDMAVLKKQVFSRQLFSVVRAAAVKPQPWVSSALQYTVSVFHGNSWATGIILDHEAGIVVTNAHVVQGGVRQLFIQTADGESHHKATVRRSFEGVVDIAFLYVPGLSQKPAPQPVIMKQPSVGQHIAVMGFPLWNPTTSPRLSSPKVTTGIVTSTVNNEYISNMAAFTTSAKVISGASGSPVIDKESGYCLGMVSSNTKIVSPSTSTVYPHLNFCIPSNIIIQAYDIVVHNRSDQEFDSIKGIQHAWDKLASFEDIPSTRSKL
jgi:S1-C subfamily serine protease